MCSAWQFTVDQKTRQRTHRLAHPTDPGVPFEDKSG
jgi:hypothetical protein